MVPFISLINSPKSLNTMTGIPTFDLLNKIEELYRLEFPDKRSHNLSYKERFVMVFMKLKQDLSFIVLSILFKNVSPESCRLIYTSIILSLAMILNSDDTYIGHQNKKFLQTFHIALKNSKKLE